MALQILNLDIFIQDDEQLSLLSVPTANSSDDEEIDSVVEYITAVVFRKIKTPGQNGNKPNKHPQAHKHMGMKMIDLQQGRYLVSEDDFKEGSTFSFIKNYHYQFCKEITPPPPKA